MNCDCCREPIMISAEAHYHLIIEGEGEEAEQFDFCSWICLRGWVG